MLTQGDGVVPDHWQAAQEYRARRERGVACPSPVREDGPDLIQLDRCFDWELADTGGDAGMREAVRWSLAALCPYSGQWHAVAAQADAFVFEITGLAQDYHGANPNPIHAFVLARLLGWPAERQAAPGFTPATIAVLRAAAEEQLLIWLHGLTMLACQALDEQVLGFREARVQPAGGPEAFSTAELIETIPQAILHRLTGVLPCVCRSENCLRYHNLGQWDPARDKLAEFLLRATLNGRPFAAPSSRGAVKYVLQKGFPSGMLAACLPPRCRIEVGKMRAIWCDRCGQWRGRPCNDSACAFPDSTFPAAVLVEDQLLLRADGAGAEASGWVKGRFWICRNQECRRQLIGRAQVLGCDLRAISQHLHLHTGKNNLGGHAYPVEEPRCPICHSAERSQRPNTAWVHPEPAYRPNAIATFEPQPAAPGIAFDDTGRPVPSVPAPDGTRGWSDRPAELDRIEANLQPELERNPDGCLAQILELLEADIRQTEGANLAFLLEANAGTAGQWQQLLERLETASLEDTPRNAQELKQRWTRQAVDLPERGGSPHPPAAPPPSTALPARLPPAQSPPDLEPNSHP
jgi:hypothetical protein